MKIFFLDIYDSKPIKNHKAAWFLLITCTLFAFLRLPSLIEPHWYSDEGIYQVVGRAIDAGRVLYRDIWDNKPPLLYLIYALFGGSLFWVKLLSLFYGLFAVISLFILAKQLFKKVFSQYFATLLFAILFATPILEGNIANAENFMLFPIILAGYFTLIFLKQRKYLYIILAGLLLSVAFITKIVAVFDFCAFLFFMMIVELRKSGHFQLKNFSKKPFVLFITAFSSLLLLCIVYFFSIGALGDFYNGVFLQNVGYVGNQNAFVFPMGILIIKTVALLFILGALIYKSKVISKERLFIYSWIIFAIYNAFFSQRPYIHYLLVMLPAFCLIVGYIFETSKARIFNGLVVIGIVLLAFFHFQVYVKTIPYYINYFEFITNHKNIVSYEAFFDPKTPRDYEIANFINMNVKRNEKIFLWSDSAQIYALSNKLPIGKYIVAYHITFYKNAEAITRQQIEKDNPRYIIQTISMPLKKNMLTSYQLRYLMDGVKIYERQI